MPNEMTPVEVAKILQKAIDTWGPTLQEDVCIEEMSELTKAIIKHRRASNNLEIKTGPENIIEEIADVQIMLDQMRLIYGDTAEQEAFKVERLRKRLEESQ
jgi:hypothetical protein